MRIGSYIQGVSVSVAASSAIAVSCSSASSAPTPRSTRPIRKDLRQLLLVSQDALGAFAIVEQLGYALGLPELAVPAFRIVAEKTKDQLSIQEYMLEMGPVAILYHEDA